MAPTSLRPSRPTPTVKPTKTRYFKGKAPEAPPSDSDSDDEEVTSELPKAKIDRNVVAGGAGRVIQPGKISGLGMGGGGMKVELKDVKVEGGRVLLGGQTGKVGGEASEEEETDDEEEEEVKAPVKVIKPPGSESSEYETDSEEVSEEEKKPAFRPVFVKKDARGMTQAMILAQAEEKVRLEEEMEVQRKIDSKELAGETIRRELLEKEALTTQPDVDDTDHLDPSSEFEAWRLRELSRLLRDKSSQAERDLEKEEIERRRAMPEEQRLREDMEYADGTRAKEKGQMGFLQKYYHKGAFHQDDDLLARDYTGATASAVDMSMLPKVMQVRNFGKMSRTKYTHLTDQDTSGGGWGTAARQTSSGVPGQQQQQGCWNCGGPHMRADCPNANPNDPMGGVGGNGIGTSANTASLGFGTGTGGGGGSGLQRSWGGTAVTGGDGRSGEKDEQSGSRYRQEGRERRFEEERRDSDRNARDAERSRRDERLRRDDRGDERTHGEARDRSDRVDKGERRGEDRHRDRGSERDRERHRDVDKHGGQENGDKRGDKRRSDDRERRRSRSPERRREREKERHRDDRRRD